MKKILPATLELDQKKLLGFRIQAVEQTSGTERNHKIAAKIGGKPADKLGAKVGSKPTAHGRIGAKVGSKGIMHSKIGAKIGSKGN